MKPQRFNDAPIQRYSAVHRCIAVSLVVCLWAFGLLASGCASRAHGGTDAQAPRVDAMAGEELVIPLALGQVDPWRSLVARIDNGKRLDAKIWQVTVLDPPEASGDQWLPVPGVWSARAPSSRNRSSIPIGTWVAVVNMPADGQGRVLSLGKQQYSLNWLTFPTLAPKPEGTEVEPLLDPWLAPGQELLATDPSLLSRTRPEAQNPLTRWRFNLLVNGLRPGGPGADALPFKDPVVEAIAQQSENRWRTALISLWATNPELASRLKARLAAVADFGNHTLAPVWSADQVGLDRLLSDLLNPAISAQRRAELAEAWMTDQPGGAVWVIDDGGLLDDQRGAIIPTVGIANLQDRKTLVWAATRGAPTAPDPNPVASMGTIKLVAPPPARDEAAATTTIIAHVGRWSAEVAAVSHRLPVVPPAFTMGPLLSGYTMQAWQQAQNGGSAPQARAEWATAAMLHKPAPDPAAAPSSAESRRWELLVECRTATAIKDIESLKREAVWLYFGPSARPTKIVRVDLSGTVKFGQPRDPLVPPEMDQPPGHVDINRAVDRWSFRLMLPPGAVEPDGLLRIGIVRMDATGRRSSWPRPMLPWHPEPGRAALDTSAWSGGLGQP